MQIGSLKDRAVKYFHTFENGAILLTLALLIFFPASDMVVRLVGTTGVLASSDYLYHLVIWFTLLGAMIASRENKHISLAVLDQIVPEDKQRFIKFITATASATLLFTFGFASIDHFSAVFCADWDGNFPKVGIIQTRHITALFPLAFVVMAFRATVQKSRKFTALSIIISLVIPIFILGVPSGYISAVAPGFMPSEQIFGLLFIPFFIILLIATILGTPIFVTLASVAALLFFKSEQMLGYLPNEAYEVLTDPIFPTIPLFTMAGFILSESKSGERLVSFFRALFGSIPGGIAIMAVVVSAFFTTFTGASGVTILALGGLLHYIMTKEGYSEKFTVGYLTSSGSIGLLFPPSLPIILYGVQAQVNIKHIFAGGIIPGILLVSVLSIYAIVNGKPTSHKREKFSFPKLLATFKDAAFEVLLPFIIVILYFSGLATLIETGVIAVVYMTVTNLFIHKDFTLKEFPKILLKAAPIAGAVLIILASAKGLSYYIVDAEIPMSLTAWFQEHIHSKWLFLLILNVLLLFTGFFMDIFSAIIVVVPLILPLAEAFDVNPVHLGIIFLANLELGYLTPPVGLNLFLSALRFEKPLLTIYKAVIPFLVIMIGAVLIITYVPQLTLIGVKIFGLD
jgi:C4-dicarboxylate transporter DctM subunit